MTTTEPNPIPIDLRELDELRQAADALHDDLRLFAFEFGPLATRVQELQSRVNEAKRETFARFSEQVGDIHPGTLVECDSAVSKIIGVLSGYEQMIGMLFECGEIVNPEDVLDGKFVSLIARAMARGEEVED